MLNEGPFGQGTRWRETRRIADQARVSEELAVVAAEPPRTCTITSPGDGADYRITYTFTRVEAGRRRSGTEVEAVLDGRPVSRVSRLLAFFLGGLAARTVEGALRDDLAALETACLHRATPNWAAA